jgi:hypothetical protein
VNGDEEDLTPEDDATIQARFEEFHRLNPMVYATLVRLAREFTRTGRSKLGVGMLWEVMRWHIYMATKDPSSDFKLNDHYRSRYARLIQDTCPDLDGLFELRRLRTP